MFIKTAVAQVIQVRLLILFHEEEVMQFLASDQNLSRCRIARKLELRWTPEIRPGVKRVEKRCGC